MGMRRWASLLRKFLGRTVHRREAHSDTTQTVALVASDVEVDLVLRLKYQQAQSHLQKGNISEALKLLCQITELSKRSAGSSHPRTLLYLDTLVSAYIRSGDMVDADPLLRSLLKTRLETGCIEDAHTTLSNASVVVTTYINQDRWNSALSLQTQVARLLRRYRAPNDTERLLACSLLAIALVECGKYPEARRLLQTISGDFVRSLGREHKETLRVFFLLAAVMEKQDDSVGAQAVLERSHKMALAYLGEDDDLTLRMGTKLACLLLRARRYAEGQSLLLTLLAAAERVTDATSATTLTNLNNLAVALWEQGRRTVARGIAAEVFARRETELGRAHPETRQAFEQLSNMDRKLSARGNSKLITRHYSQ